MVHREGTRKQQGIKKDKTEGAVFPWREVWGPTMTWAL